MISIVDDDDSIRSSTKALLRSAGYEVRVFASADDLLKSRILSEIECLILDIRMPGIDGLMLFKYLRDEGFRIPTIFVTAYDDKFVRERAMRCGAMNVLHKPFDAAYFLAVVQTALRGDPPHIPYKALLRLAHSCLAEHLGIASTSSAEESNHLHECPECIDALGNIVREILRGQQRRKAARIVSGE